MVQLQQHYTYNSKTTANTKLLQLQRQQIQQYYKYNNIATTTNTTQLPQIQQNYKYNNTTNTKLNNGNKQPQLQQIQLLLQQNDYKNQYNKTATTNTTTKLQQQLQNYTKNTKTTTTNISTIKHPQIYKTNTIAPLTTTKDNDITTETTTGTKCVPTAPIKHTPTGFQATHKVTEAHKALD